MKRFFVDACRKDEAATLLLKYHYLKDISKGFRSGHNFGLYKGCAEDVFLGKLSGVCIFTGLPVPEIAVGAFGLDRTDQDGLFELSRLVLHPDEQSTEHNLATWFVARAIRLLRTRTNVRAIISYADTAFHNGTVYAASNFLYCGVTAEKFDYVGVDGSAMSRGSTPEKGMHPLGTKPRTQKHRFVKVFDASLDLKWKIERWGYTTDS